MNEDLDQSSVGKLVDNPCVTVEKTTEIFCENMKALMFNDKKCKRSIFKNYNIDKNLRVFM
jgi:hypothetical protein